MQSSTNNSPAWRFVVPAALGGIVGLILAAMFVGIGGAPAWMMIAGPVLGFFVIGVAGKQQLDDIFGPRGG